jgi:phosphohistidine phosphatase
MQGIGDEERPLLPKGIEKTKMITDYLIRKNIKPDLIISSHAIRAYETAKILATDLEYPVAKIRIDRKVYEGSEDRILDIIYSLPDEISSVMVVGHNPTITILANLFLRPGVENMRTSAVAAFSFDTEKWEEIPSQEAKLNFFIYPRMLA